MLELTQKNEHHPDYMAAAVMEAGLQLAVIAFGRERLANTTAQD